MPHQYQWTAITELLVYTKHKQRKVILKSYQRIYGLIEFTSESRSPFRYSLLDIAFHI